MFNFFLRYFLWLIVKIFFSNVEVIGRHNIPDPKEGPIIFVGNHQNQFVDPILLFTTAKRPISFLIAKKSYDMRLIGDVAKLSDSIPVIRPQDEARKGKGKIIKYEDGILIGEGTEFKKQVNINDCIFLNTSASSSPPPVLEIISDTKLKLKFAPDVEIESGKEYKIFPNIDHSKVYKVVWEKLIESKNIAIFPEGGSHDQTHLLPLKAGVTLMALGALNKDPNLKLRIVPCGLNYFQGHRFRSHVLVNFGAPIEIPSEISLQYKTNKREACGKLLSMIQEGLESVTVNYPTYDIMNVAHTVRRLYQPENKEIPAEEYIRLQQRFVKGFLQMKEVTEVKSLISKVELYNNKLREFGLKDFQIKNLETGAAAPIGLVILRALYLFSLLVLSLPGSILLAPIGAIAKSFATRKAKEALSRSTVKINGTDVIASFKVIISLVLVPSLLMFYTLLCTYFYGIKAGIVLFFLLPLLSYASIKILEEGTAVWRSTLPLVLNLLTSNFKQECDKLRTTRKELQQEARDLIEKYGPQMGKDFWSDRVIRKEEIEEDEKSGNEQGLFKYKRRIYHTRKIDDNYSILDGLQEEFN